jgi:starch synthase
MSPLRVQFVSSEIYPLAKTGGLADVCSGLPLSLSRLGVDVRLVLPGYEEALDVAEHLEEDDVREVLGIGPVRILRGMTPDSGLPVWLVDCPPLFRRSGGLYQDSSGCDWPDNAIRFAVLCHVAAHLASRNAQWRPDIVHCHDWHTGLVPLLLWRKGRTRPATVFTIHNMAFQGVFPADLFSRLGLPPECFTPDGVEFYGGISFLKSGIRYADRLTTVSPTYAREIQTPEFGLGLEGLVQSRANDLVGIINGIDTGLWDPARDGHIPCRYSGSDMSGKAHCKTELQQELGLVVDPGLPLLASASRLTSQKMADVVLSVLPEILNREPRIQFALLGRGDARLEHGFRQVARRFPGRIAVDIGYSESGAHRLHAGADLLIHGSRFEPCGLAQLYAMRYGTVPVVRRTGGLADTVIDADPGAIADGTSTGIAFDEPTASDLVAGLDRGLSLYENRAVWSRIRSQAMRGDFSWRRSAEAYSALYESLAPARRLDTDMPEGHAVTSFESGGCQ